MIIDEKRLRKQLEDKGLTFDVRDKVIIALKEQGLPLVTAVTSFVFKIGQEVCIKFVDENGNSPKGAVLSHMWKAKIGDIDPNQIRTVEIPELRYDEIDIMTIDLTIYPFKMEKPWRRIK